MKLDIILKIGLNWVKSHDKVYQRNDKIGNLNVEELVDSFYEWRYKTSYDKNPLTNPHSKFNEEDLMLFNKNDTKFCCTDATPFIEDQLTLEQLQCMNVVLY